MAKKAKKKLGKDDDYKTFKFPEFDVKEFILHELEQTSATVLSVIVALVVALACWQLTAYGLAIRNPVGMSMIALMVGIVGAVVLPFLIRHLREKSTEYRMGDWAGLIALYIFLWLGLWSLLVNL